MRYLQTYLYCVLLLSNLGCMCKRLDSTPQPPNHVVGWQRFRDQDLWAKGEFVLNQGESVEHANLGITIIKTIPSQKCSDPWAEQPSPSRAMLRIYRLPEKRLLLEGEFSPGNTRLISFNFPVDEFGIDSILVKEINSKDQWVWFEVLE